VERREYRIAWGVAALLLLNGLAVGQESSALSLTARIPLQNVKGRIDHFGVDLKAALTLEEAK